MKLFIEELEERKSYSALFLPSVKEVMDAGEGRLAPGCKPPSDEPRKTTLALGEEGGWWRGGRLTTQAIGEEGNMPWSPMPRINIPGPGPEDPRFWR